MREKSPPSIPYLLHTSITCERAWHTIHSDIGPILLAVWYRPPAAGEVVSISSFEDELNNLRESRVGVILVGDLSSLCCILVPGEMLDVGGGSAVEVVP